MRFLRLSSLSLFSFLLTLTLTELMIRSFLPHYNPSTMLWFELTRDGIPFAPRNSIRLNWKNTGDYNVSIRINRWGFRDMKDLRSSGPKDIFVVGDSFAFGWGVEEGEAFPSLLQKSLKIPVYNISTGSADLSTYEKLIQYALKNGAKMRRLLVSVCMENDLRNYNHLFPSSPKHSWSTQRIKRWLSRHSALYHFLAVRLHRNAFFLQIAGRLGLYTPNEKGIVRSDFSNEALSSSAEKISNLAQSFDTYVLLIPSRALWMGSGREEAGRVHQKFVQKLQTLGVRVIDLKPSFEAGGNPLQYHFKRDGHWNSKGHLRTSEVIVSRMSPDR